jgi:hypothetical protein
MADPVPASAVWIPPWWHTPPTPGGSEQALIGPEPSPVYANLNRAVSPLPPPAQGGDPWWPRT